MVDPGIIIAVLTLVSAVVVALIGWLQHRGSKSAEKDATDVQTIITELRTRLDASEEKIEKLEKQMTVVQAERDALWRENRDLRDVNRDQSELIDDVLAHFVDVETWESAGANPPPPLHSWRIRAALADYRAHRFRTTDPDPQGETHG